VHLPELVLGAGCLGSLGGDDSELMKAQRKMTIDVTQIFPIRIFQIRAQLELRNYGCAARSLKVGVLEKRDGCAGRAVYLIGLRNRRNRRHREIQ
jgi:hypothetical protein